LANLGLPIVSILNYGAVSGSDSTTAIQAAIDAVGNNSIVVIPAGTYTVSAKLTVQHANEVIRGMGGVLNCAMTSDYCLEIGGGGNYSYYGNKIENVILQPGAQSTKAAIHDTAWQTNIVDPSYQANGSNYFYYLIQNDNDQSETISGMKNVWGVLRCDLTFCGSAV